jgi:RHS repeat-associated protein
LLPGGVTVKQEYNAAGYQYQTIADGTVISEIKAMDDAGRVTQAAFVGGSKRSIEYTPERGFIKNIEVQDGLNKTLYTVDYGYSLRGDTKSRLSKYTNGTSSTIVDESYTYSTDGHFRLEKRDVAVTAPQVLGNLVTPMSQSFSYDSLGNLKTKSGVGTYEYDSANPYLLRKTTGAAAGVRSYVMTGATDYDAHGNIKADGQRTFAYNQADMPTLISKGADNRTSFDYAPDNSRIYREDTRSGSVTKTWYVGKTYEYSEKGSDSEQRWYLGNVVMSQSSKTSGTNFEVLHGDAQGSTVTVTDGSGNLVSHSLYDAWGQQSVLQVGPTSQLFIQSLQRRGYTGHENVEGLGIIHMNGRIYDPLLARFVQADPTLQFTQLSQGYNRYSYVLNNPMTYTDPSGYFVKWVMEKTGIADTLRFIASVPLLDAIVSIGLNFIPFCAGGWCTAVYQGMKTYAVATKRGQPPFKKWLASFGKKKQQCCSVMKFQRCMGIFILIIGFDFF